MVTYFKRVPPINQHDPLVATLWSTTRRYMATKFGTLVIYLDGLLTIKSLNALIRWSCKITWQRKNISTTKDPMATKLGKVITYVDGLIFTKSHDSLIMCSYEITWQTKSIVSNTAVLIATKLDRMVNYFKRLPPIK